MAKSSTPPTPAPESRYARVKAILGAAAAGSRSDYGGLGQFWNLPLDELKEAKIYGVRLIAPAIAMPPCCEAQGLSASSGLIRGLRGLPPFDGSRFPPLMWGGHRVAEDDIALIADWIDDGCPPDDEGRTPLDISTPELLRARVMEPRGVPGLECGGATLYVSRRGAAAARQPRLPLRARGRRAT